MRKYISPILEEEKVIIEDVIAASLGGNIDINDGGIPTVGPGDFTIPQA